MPLKKSPTKAAFKSNVKAEINAAGEAGCGDCVQYEARRER